MGLGIYTTSNGGVAEFPCPVAPSSSVVACNVAQQNAPQGQMDFIKRGAGGEIYIGLCGKKASAGQYDIVLTDVSPSYNLNGLAVGDVYVVSSTAGNKVSITILMCVK